MSISIVDLARKLNLDGSTIRKKIVKDKMKSIKVKKNNRVQLTVSDADAELLISHFTRLPDAGGNTSRSAYGKPDEDSTSARQTTLYVIQTTPDTKATRIKVGLSDTPDAQGRMRYHRCSCPTLRMLRLYPVAPAHETVILQYLIKQEKQIGTEVFDVRNLSDTLKSIDDFFAFLGIEPTFKA
jgi:hypothetical protein